MKYLGIEQGCSTPEIKSKIERKKMERQKAEVTKQLRTDLQNTFLILISATKKAAKNFKISNDLDRHGDILRPLSYWEHCLDILAFGAKEDQELVIEQFKDDEILPVKRFFKPEFDYFKWLSKFHKNGELKVAKFKRIRVSFN